MGILTPRGLVTCPTRTTQEGSASLPPVVHKVQVAVKRANERPAGSGQSCATIA
ncbi:hypothetical protein HanIR_Chr01g0014261 [Helianthus annuus]|nr:hypothetical protein HanIR_Chr01g0014261 [Helianthus annuus]